MLVQNGWYHGVCWQLRPCRRMSCQLFCSQNQECRGRSPLPGCGARASGGCNSGLPQISFFLSPPQAARKARIIMNNIVQQDMLQQLQQLQQNAQTALTQATTTEATREWYSEYLSRKGRL